MADNGAAPLKRRAPRKFEMWLNSGTLLGLSIKLKLKMLSNIQTRLSSPNGNAYQNTRQGSQIATRQIPPQTINQNVQNALKKTQVSSICPASQQLPTIPHQRHPRWKRCTDQRCTDQRCTDQQTTATAAHLIPLNCVRGENYT